MDENSSKKDESTSSSLIELLERYKSRVGEREILANDMTRVSRPQQISKIEKSLKPLFLFLILSYQ